MSPTQRAALAVGVIALAALLVPWWLAAAALAAVVGAVAADLYAIRKPVDVEVTAPPILARGIPATLRLEAGATGGAVRLRQPAAPDLVIAEQEGPGALQTTITGRRRGRHLLPSPAVRVTGPLGLGAWHRRAGEDRELLVYPDLPAARRIANNVRQGRFRFEGRARGPLGLGTDFESIRDYQPDDDVRQVNWLATHRLGRPMSNQYRVERDRDVICLVDCGRLMAAPLDDRTRLDAAVDAATAVAAVADVLADRSGAIAFDSEVRRNIAPRRAGGRAVLQAVFDVEPSPVDSDYERAFAALAEAKRAFVIVFTDLLDESAARPLLDAVPVLSRRHVVTVASSTDPDLDRLLTRPASDRAGVYRMAVAQQVEAARAGVAANLRRRGVDVVDAPAHQLAAASVRSYLRAKSRALV